MKVITEAALRDELRNSEPEIYYISEGKVLSPAAREYLQQRKIKISKEPKPETVTTGTSPMPATVSTGESSGKPRYIDYESGAFYAEKPEHMTQLNDNALVSKNHPRILFRGKLDSLQALIALTQCDIQSMGGSAKLISDLQGIMEILREMMRCDVLNERLMIEKILGLTHAQLRERSHDPMKYYNIRRMVLPDYSLGREYALLNRIRTAVRETEIAAVEAFKQGRNSVENGMIKQLNRLSSAIYIMMCMYLAGEYK